MDEKEAELLAAVGESLPTLYICLPPSFSDLASSSSSSPRSGRSYGYGGYGLGLGYPQYLRKPGRIGVAHGSMGSSSNSILSSLTGGLLGSPSRSSHGYYEDCPGIPLALLLLLGSALAIMLYTLYTKITMIGRRRKRSFREELQEQMGAAEAYMDDWNTFVTGALEEFEEKVDKLVAGKSDDSSWIGKMYNKLKVDYGGDVSGGDPPSAVSQEGLEPPILDETWGLDDVGSIYTESNKTSSSLPINTTVSNVNVAEAAEEFDDDDDDEEDAFSEILSGEAKCRTRFWKCIARVVKGGMQYMDQPGGVTGAIQKAAFKVAFTGGIGNAWNTLMTIPEARKAKRCVNKRDDCLSFEAIRKEAGGAEADSPRLIVNPDFVENQDTSDGATQFDDPSILDNLVRGA